MIAWIFLKVRHSSLYIFFHESKNIVLEILPDFGPQLIIYFAVVKHLGLSRMI
jgi:hypothetical protein